MSHPAREIQWTRLAVDTIGKSVYEHSTLETTARGIKPRAWEQLPESERFTWRQFGVAPVTALVDAGLAPIEAEYSFCGDEVAMDLVRRYSSPWRAVQTS